MNSQNDIFTEIYDGAIDTFIDPEEQTLEEEEFQSEEFEINQSMRKDLDSLLQSGSISDSIDLVGHTFVLRTLTIGEELAVASVCDDYAKSIAQSKAIATATVAAALESIDGRPLMHSISPDPLVNIRHKFGYIRNKWYWAIIEELYRRYVDLSERQLYAFQELQGK
jgi:hypothetical protein